MKGGEAARLYAESLFDVALQAGQIAQVAHDLDVITAALREEPRVLTLVAHPRIPLADKHALFERSLASVVTTSSLNFVKVLVTRRRLQLLDDIRSQYHDLLARNEHRLVVHVTSARPLSEADMDLIRSATKGADTSTVDVRAAVDPSVLGGVVIRLHEQLFDGSVRARLRQMRNQMAGARLDDTVWAGTAAGQRFTNAHEIANKLGG